MNAPKMLDVDYHHQDDPGDGRQFCGAAAAQMVLHALGTDLINQSVLYDTNTVTADCVAWYTAPDGLCSTMETYGPEDSPKFEMWALSSKDALARKVCWSIHNYGIAPIVLFDAFHWVVVTGFLASREPVAPDDTLYEIDRFFVHDPSPLTSSGASTPPHTSSDIVDDGCRARGEPYKEFPYAVFRGRLVRFPDGVWKGKYLVVCDTDSPAGLPDAPSEIGDELVEPLEIAFRANQEVFDFNLLSPGSLGDAPDAVQGDPVRVEREDLDPPRYFYIVPFRRPDGEIPLLVNVSAHKWGGVNGSSAAPPETARFARALDRQRVVQEFAGREVDVGGRVVRLREEDLYEYLVWRPCAESPSPYLPFYRFDAEGHDGVTKVYVRIDGVLFPELHVRYGM